MMRSGQGVFFNRLLMNFPFEGKQLMQEGFGLDADL